MELGERLDEDPDGGVGGREGSIESIVPSFGSVLSTDLIVLDRAVDVPKGRGVGGGEKPGLLEVGNVFRDFRGWIEEPEPRLNFRPGGDDVDKRKEGKPKYGYY